MASRSPRPPPQADLCKPTCRPVSTASKLRTPIDGAYGEPTGTSQSSAGELAGDHQLVDLGLLHPPVHGDRPVTKLRTADHCTTRSRPVHYVQTVHPVYTHTVWPRRTPLCRHRPASPCSTPQTSPLRATTSARCSTRLSLPICPS